MFNVGVIEAILRLKDTMSPGLVVAARNLKQTGAQITKFGDGVASTGRRLLPFSLAVAAIGVGAITAASSFESSFAGVRKTVNATEAEFASLSTGFRKMSREIPVSVNELNKIGEAAGQLGIETENIVGFTRTMADLGVTTNLSADEAATALARLANITGLPQTEFDRLGSTIVDLGNNLATTEAEIVEFGLRIAGAGTIAGLTEAQILAIGGAMSSVGIEAAAGGTAVQKVLIGMTEAVEFGGKKLEIFASTAGLSARDFATAFEQDAGAAFTAFTEGIGAQGIQAIATLEDLNFTDQRLIKAFLSLGKAGDITADAMRLATKAFAENTALSKEAEERYKTFASQVGKLWNKVFDLGVVIGTSLMPTMKDLIGAMEPVLQRLADAATWFAALPKPVRTTALAVGVFMVALAPVLIALGSLISLAGLTVSALGTLAGGAGLAGATAAAGGTAIAASGAATAITTLGATAGAALGGIVLVARAMSLTKKEADGATLSTSQLTQKYIGLTVALGPFADVFLLVQKHLKSKGVNIFGRALESMGQKAAKSGSELAGLSGSAQEVFARISGLGLRKEVNALSDAFSVLTAHGRPTAEQFHEVASAAQELKDRGANVGVAFEHLIKVYGDIAPAAEGAVAALTELVLTEEELEEAAKRAAGAHHREMVNSMGVMTMKIEATERAFADYLKTIEKVNRALPGLIPPPNALQFDLAGIKSNTLAGIHEMESNFLSTMAVIGQKAPDLMIPPPSAFNVGFAKALAGVPQAIMGALKGGGDVGGAVGSTVFGNIFSAGSSLVTKLTSKLSGALGSTIGGALGSVIPGIGTMLGGMAGKLIGPLIGKIGGFFSGLFGGKSQARQDMENANRQIQAYQRELLLTHGSLDNIRKMGGAAGEELANAWGSQNVRGLEHFTRLMREFEDSVDDSAKAAERLARETEELERIARGSLGDMTDVVEILQAKLDNIESIKRLEDAFTTFGEGGVFDLRSIMREVESLERSFGSAHPAVQTLQEVIRHFAATGVLDFATLEQAFELLRAELGEGLEMKLLPTMGPIPPIPPIPVTLQPSLADLRNFMRASESERIQFGGMNENELWGLVNRFAGPEGSDPGDYGRIPSAFGISSDVLARMGVPGFAGGTPGLGFMNFGAGTNIRAHGEEAIVPKARAGEFAAQHVSMDGVERRLDRLEQAIRHELPASIAVAVEDAVALRAA